MSLTLKYCYLDKLMWTCHIIIPYPYSTVDSRLPFTFFLPVEDDDLHIESCIDANGAIASIVVLIQLDPTAARGCNFFRPLSESGGS